LQHFKDLLTPRTKLVCLVHVSNMLGSVLDTDFVVEEARKVGHCCFLCASHILLMLRLLLLFLLNSRSTKTELAL